MSRSGGASSRPAALFAAGPRAAAAPARRKSRREAIATGRVVVGFVTSVLSPGGLPERPGGHPEPDLEGAGEVALVVEPRARRHLGQRLPRVAQLPRGGVQ